MRVADQTFSDLCRDIFDIRDVITRYEAIETVPDDGTEDEDAEERTAISSFLDEVRGYGGDHQWRGDWYPAGFIADHYFEKYAQELAEDIGAIGKDAPWPACHIDWEAAAESLQQDYSSVEIDGTTYWYR